MLSEIKFPWAPVMFFVGFLGGVIIGSHSPAEPQIERDIVPTRVVDCRVLGVDQSGKPSWIEARCSR